MAPSKLSVAVEEWKKLWWYGANGENIKNITVDVNKKKNNKRKQSKISDIYSAKPHNKIQETHQWDKDKQQLDLQGHNQDEHDADAFADVLQRKPENVVRVMLHNISRLPIDRRTTKSRKLVSTLAHTQTDIALLTEIGLNWTLLDNRDRWYERTREAFQSTRSSLAFNKTELHHTKKVQFGGTGVIAIDDITHKIVSQGVDPTGLGRWAWLRFHGKDTHHFRTVSVYRPVDSVGPGTVYSQHERYFGKHKRQVCPRAALYEDLFTAISEWKTQGDHILVGIDANEDVRTGDTKDFFRAQDMREIILDQHSTKSPPATCNKNTKRQPIDGIFATNGIKIIAGGYAPFDEGCPSDHRYLWVDISHQHAFGDESFQMVTPARRFTTQHPKIVHKYNSKTKEIIQTEKLSKSLFQIESTAQINGWSQELENEYNRINNRQYVLRKTIAEKIRKLRMGGVVWSPKLQVYRTAIKIWSMLLRKRKGQNVSNKKYVPSSPNRISKEHTR